jgi:hypothetical protein
MSLKILTKIKLLLKPPKVGDIFYGDPVSFVIGRPVEQVLHGLKDPSGTTLAEPVPSEDCYALTIVSDSQHAYYVLNAMVFCRRKNLPDSASQGFGEWKPRSQVRRIPRDVFKKMVVDGILKKGK